MSMSTFQRLSTKTYRAIQGPHTSATIRRFAQAIVVKEHDVVFLKNTTNPNASEIITHPLCKGGEHVLSRSKDHARDTFKHDEIIGKEFRDVVRTRKGVAYRILQPSLGEYTDNSPRLVTPIYSQDANLIVSLLDLHPTVPGERGTQNVRLEIFEAGTGHGALTLNLARAIHAANPPAPQRLEEEDSTPTKSPPNETSEYSAWRMNRRAVIQTLDSCQQHSRHAEKVVQNFRHGMYYGDIDFHVGSINNYLVERLQVSSNEPFLDHAILDLPSTEDYFDIIGCAMKPGGTLLTFCPSITQITEGVLKVRGADLPFWLERVVEVGGGVGVGGREWDVRPVKPRAALKAEQGILDETKTSPPALEDTSRREQHSIAGGMDSGWSMVCRPKVGRQVVGGGFVAVWRRMVELAV